MTPSPSSRSTKGYFELEGYQFKAIDFGLATPRCALWMDLGLGKTAVTLSILDQLIREQEIKRTLVVGPLRVVRKGWPDEIDSWSHLTHLRAVKCIGDQGTRLTGLRTEGDLHLINFHNLLWLLKLFYRVEKRPGQSTLVTQLRKFPWDCIVIDEAVNMQDPTGAWFTAMRYLQRPVKRVIQLTGDAIPNGYMGLWSQMYLLDQGKRLKGSITSYRKEHFDYNHEAGSYTIKETSPARIQNAVADITLTLREEDHLKHLPPPPAPEFVRIDLTKQETAKYREMQRKYVMTLDDQEITAVNAGVVWGKLLQLSNGSIWVDDQKWLPFHDHKLRALEQLLPTIEGPSLIVYLYKPDLARIGQVLTRMRRKWKLLESEQDEDDFNEDRLDDLVMHPLSGGHGLNIHFGSAKTVIWFGMTPSADRYKQTNARLFGGRRRLKKPDGRILHIVGNGTQDLIVVDKIKTHTFNSESMKEAMVRLHQEAHS